LQTYRNFFNQPKRPNFAPVRTSFMRISASVASVSSDILSDCIRQLDAAGVDFFHLDSIEDPSIFGYARDLRQHTETPFDLHLITDSPAKFWDDIRSSDITRIHFQLENLQKPLFVPGDLQGKVGIAIHADTNPERFAVYQNDATSALLMLTTPGISGGTFKPEHFASIIRFRELYPDTPLTIDGGVNHEVAAVLRLMGIDTIVSGSYLFKGNSIAESVGSLKFHDGIPWLLKDVMVPGIDLFHNDNRNFGVLPRTWFVNELGGLEEVTQHPAWEQQCAQVMRFRESAGMGIFADELTPLSQLRSMVQVHPFLPRYVFAINNDRAISGSFFIENIQA
jgi:pentose-5-phosphate-3-epimerase